MTVAITKEGTVEATVIATEREVHLDAVVHPITTGQMVTAVDHLDEVDTEGAIEAHLVIETVITPIPESTEDHQVDEVEGAASVARVTEAVADFRSISFFEFSSFFTTFDLYT